MNDQSQAAAKAAERILSATIAAFQIGALSHEHQVALREAFAIDIDSLLTSHTETIAALTTKATDERTEFLRQINDLNQRLATVTAERDSARKSRDRYMEAFAAANESRENEDAEECQLCKQLSAEVQAHAATIEGLKREIKRATVFFIPNEFFETYQRYTDIPACEVVKGGALVSKEALLKVVNGLKNGMTADMNAAIDEATALRTRVAELEVSGLQKDEELARFMTAREALEELIGKAESELATVRRELAPQEVYDSDAPSHWPKDRCYRPESYEEYFNRVSALATPKPTP